MTNELSYGHKYARALEAIQDFARGKVAVERVAELCEGLGMTAAAGTSIGLLLVYIDPRQHPPERCPARHVVEMAAAVHPLLVDALYRIDVEFPEGVPHHSWENKFHMATYSSFFRPEITRAMGHQDRCFDGMEECRRVALLVPCSADKPYPSREHEAYLKLLAEVDTNNDVDLVIVSTALGPIHPSSWDVIPEYDSGLPLFDRLRSTVPYRLRSYQHLIVHTDMLTNDLMALAGRLPPMTVTGLQKDLRAAQFSFVREDRMKYGGLTSELLLERLRCAIAEVCKTLETPTEPSC